MPTPTTPVLPSYQSKETVMAEHQPEYKPEYKPLPALQSAKGILLTRWKFTDEERVAIALGADILVAIHTFNQPLQPVLLYVPGCDRDALLLAAELEII